MNYYYVVIGVIIELTSIRCYSNLGMVGGRQDISIGMGCTKKAGIIQHEILHALGRIHEQSRHDRDDYVDIRLNNIVQTGT